MSTKSFRELNIVLLAEKTINMLDAIKAFNECFNLQGKLHISLENTVTDSEYSDIRRAIAKHYNLTGDGYTITQGLSVKVNKQ